MLERESEGDAFNVAPGSKIGVAWVLRPSGSDYQWISPDVIFFGAGDNGDVALLSAVDDDGNASYGVAAGLINGIIVGIAATIGLGALINCQAGKRKKDIEEPLLDN